MIERAGNHWRLLIGDNRETLRTLPAGSVHAVVTSPPYWGLRSYETGDAKHLELGSEPTIEEYLAAQMEVFAEVKRVLRDDGACWVNLGDSYAGGGSGKSNAGSTLQGSTARQEENKKSSRPIRELAAGNQCLVPHRFALAMQSAGWVLRSTVIWHKASPMPESLGGTKWVRCRMKVASRETLAERYEHAETSNGRPHDVKPEWLAKWLPCPGCDRCRDSGGWVLRRGAWRPTTAHEYVFMFTKSMDYFSDGEACKERTERTERTPGRKNGVVGVEKSNSSFHAATAGTVDRRNPRTVWTLSHEPVKDKHFACFPTELVYRCLLPLISPGGCCAACGAQFAPLVESVRTPTRPGTNTKTNKGDAVGVMPERLDSGTIGNRDPERHTTSTRVVDYWPTCECKLADWPGSTVHPVARPVVLDPYSGLATTGRVAIEMGAEFIGCELSPEYAAIAEKKLAKRWRRKAERKAVKPVDSDPRQVELFE